MTGPYLPAHGDSEGFHFPVKMAALQAESFGSASDVALVFLQLAQDVIALVCGPRLVQRGETHHEGFGGIGARMVVIEGRGEVAALDSLALDHDDQALHKVAQLANVARPAIA